MRTGHGLPSGVLLGRAPLTSEGAGPGTTRWRACCDDGVYGVAEVDEVVGRGAHWCEAMQRPSPRPPFTPFPIPRSQRDIGSSRVSHAGQGSPAVGDSPAWGCVTRVDAGPDPSLSKGSPGVLPRGGLPPPLPLLTLGRLLGKDGTCAEACTQQQRSLWSHTILVAISRMQLRFPVWGHRGHIGDGELESS
jgi:hypothetical protein